MVGLDYKVAIVGGRPYVINPPTIHRLCGAAHWLLGVKEGESLRELLISMDNYDHLAHALSWLIQGDDALTEELMQGGIAEVLDALETAFSLISTENFLRLSVLTKSAEMLIAKPK